MATTVNAAALFASRDWGMTARVIGDALEADPDQVSADLLSILCMSLYNLGRRKEAAGAYEKFRGALPKGDRQQLILRATAATAAGHGDLESLLGALFPRSHYPVNRVRTLPVTTLAAWCDAHAVPRRVLDPPQSISLDRWQYTTEPYTMATVPGGEFVCGWDFVMTPQEELVRDTGYQNLGRSSTTDYPYFFAPDIGLAALPWPKKVADADCDALFLSAPHEFHVGHWIVDFLPRLRALQNLAPDTMIVVPNTLPQKFRDYLALFGIGRDRLAECQPGSRYRFRNLTVAQPGEMLQPNPGNVRFAAAALQPRTPRGSRRLYLHRSIGTRQFANPGEAHQVLAEFGFENVDLAQLSVKQQMDIFKDAGIVAGIFGSDLLGLHFAPPGTRVLEIIWEPAVALDPVVGPSCTFMGIHHEYLICRQAPNTEFKRHKKDRDIVVDCAELRARLKAMLERS